METPDLTTKWTRNSIRGRIDQAATAAAEATGSTTGMDTCNEKNRRERRDGETRLERHQSKKHVLLCVDTLNLHQRHGLVLVQLGRAPGTGQIQQQSNSKRRRGCSAMRCSPLVSEDGALDIEPDTLSRTSLHHDCCLLPTWMSPPETESSRSWGDDATAGLAKEIDVGWVGARGVERRHIGTRWGRGASPPVFASEAGRYRKW
jgi:hypothetical protein